MTIADFILTAASEPNPPIWPDTVTVFSPINSTAAIEAKVNKVYSDLGGRQDHGQFSNDRAAFLFMPGTYSANVPVGYYTQVLGLGSAPSDVVFDSDKGVFCEEGDYRIDVGALDTFWRGAENFETRAAHLWTDVTGMLWAVSQAAPLRRLVVTENLKLYEYRGGGAAGYASGGFLADSVVRGTVASGSQQQWLTRSSNIGQWVEGVWNMVFVGVGGAPTAHCGQNQQLCQSPYVVVERAPLVADKPFISADAMGMYSLHIPVPRRNSSGPDVSTTTNGSTRWNPIPSVGFATVYVAIASRDSASSINAKLSAGLHVVLSPGIYKLDDSLHLTTNGQVLLGLGLATLEPTNGTAAVTVGGSVTGARVAGILLQAGTIPSPTLLQWGDPARSYTYQGAMSVADADVGFMHDIFVRVGGPSVEGGAQVAAKNMVRIDSSGVVGDNLWLWRADHVEGGGIVKNGDNPCDTALVVNGDDVIMYGLAAEHTLKDVVQWNGDRGASFFFQAELPYDVQSYPYAGYAVAPHVSAHQSYGAGVYHFFRDFAVTVQSGITCPVALETSFVAPLGVFLNGNGTMLHIINSKGSATKKPARLGADPAWVCAAPATVVSTAGPAWAHGPEVSFQNGTCKIGDSVPCPGGSGNMCAGNECCAGGITCPSADPRFQCCPKPKTVDCTQPGPLPPGPHPPSPSPTPPPGPTPAPGAHCAVGAAVKCPGTSVECKGSQCCPDGSICPSAADSFHGCQHSKKVDCTRSSRRGAIEFLLTRARR